MECDGRARWTAECRRVLWRAAGIALAATCASEAQTGAEEGALGADRQVL